MICKTGFDIIRKTLSEHMRFVKLYDTAGNIRYTSALLSTPQVTDTGIGLTFVIEDSSNTPDTTDIIKCVVTDGADNILMQIPIEKKTLNNRMGAIFHIFIKLGGNNEQHS